MNKTETITIRVTKEAKERIHESAQLMGISPSAYLRSAAYIRALDLNGIINAFGLDRLSADEVASQLRIHTENHRP